MNIAHSFLLSSSCSLFFSFFFLSGLLFGVFVCCMLFVACCLLFCVCCLSYVACCMLYVFRCLVFVVCYWRQGLSFAVRRGLKKSWEREAFFFVDPPLTQNRQNEDETAFRVGVCVFGRRISAAFFISTHPAFLRLSSISAARRTQYKGHQEGKKL